MVRTRALPGVGSGTSSSRHSGPSNYDGSEKISIAEGFVYSHVKIVRARDRTVTEPPEMPENAP